MCRSAHMQTVGQEGTLSWAGLSPGAVGMWLTNLFGILKKKKKKTMNWLVT